jgi:hypothetical protein
LLERFETLEDSLGVVETVDAREDAAAAELLPEPRELVLDLVAGGQSLERLRVDRDRARARADGMAVHGDGPAAHLAVEQAAARPDEVLAVAICVEGDDVRAQQSAQDLLAPREPREQLRRRPRYVQEESDRCIGAAATQHLREEHQVIVLNPQQSVRRAAQTQPCRLPREPLVDDPVVLPPRSIEGGGLDEIVEQRPDRAIGEAVVERVHLSAAQRDGPQPHGQIGDLGGNVFRAAVPPHPRPRP